MLVQDTLTGYVHEVPTNGQMYDAELSEYPEQVGEVVYDGLGNPVGFLKWIKKAIKKVGRVAKRIAPVASFLPIPGAGFLPHALRVAGRYLPRAIKAYRRYSPYARRALRRIRRYAPVARRAIRRFRRYAPVAHRAMRSLAPQMFAGESGGYGGYYGEYPPLLRRRPRRLLPPGWRPRPFPFRGNRGRRLYLRCALWPGPRGFIPSLPSQSPGAVARPVVTAVAPVRPARRIRRRRRYRRRRR